MFENMILINSDMDHKEVPNLIQVVLWLQSDGQYAMAILSKDGNQNTLQICMAIMVFWLFRDNMIDEYDRWKYFANMHGH